MTATPQELYRQRLKRVTDAIRLKIPDRVPVLANFRFFAARHAGMTCEDVFYKPRAWMAANKKVIQEFEPDMHYGLFSASGSVFEILDLKQLKWPGHGVPPHHSHQYVEGEYMRADEYDAFIDDPSDYIFRTLLPRIYGALTPFTRLPPLKKFMLAAYKSVGLLKIFGDSEIQAAFKALLRAGEEAAKLSDCLAPFDEEMKQIGFPLFSKSQAITPFDWIGDFARGIRGVMLDMYRQPDNLLKAIDKMTPLIIDETVSAAQASGNPRVYLTLHLGADGYMSPDQFKTFYWPGLKKLLVALIEAGLTPCPLLEGEYDSRLAFFNELPRGTVLAHFENTDLFRAKKIIGDNVCLCGNVPLSLLHAGTPGEVAHYCKKLIDGVGREGGLIIAPRSVLDDARPENIKAMIDVTKSYGVYK